MHIEKLRNYNKKVLAKLTERKHSPKPKLHYFGLLLWTRTTVDNKSVQNVVLDLSQDFLIFFCKLVVCLAADLL